MEGEEAMERELQMRDVRCHMIRGDEFWYPRKGDPRRPFDADDCVRGQRWRPYFNKKRVDPFQLPVAAPFATQAAAPTLPDHIAVVSALAPAQPPAPVPAPKKKLKHFTREPGAVDEDPSRYALPTALADYEQELTQDLLYQYARGWVEGVPTGRYDRRMDWSSVTEPVDADGAPIMPPGTCGSTDMRIKPHQMTVWTVLRAWAARQGSGSGSDSVTWEAAGARKGKRRLIEVGDLLHPGDDRSLPSFDPTRTPKGFLVNQSLGSGKTNVTVCGLQAFWNQCLTDGESRPLYVITSKENKGQMAKQGDGSSRYYAAAKGMFPSSLGALSSADFHAGYELLSFNQAGLRLGYPMADLAEGATPRRDAGRAKPGFAARMRQAVIFIDEPQGMFAPLPQFRNTNGGLLQWLTSPEADGVTVVPLTATPGKSIAELFALLNALKRSHEQLAPADFVHRDKDGGEWVVEEAAFRRVVAGQVSFVDLSNNTNDFPTVSVEVVRAPMSPPHFAAWRERALADAREEAEGGPKSWAHLFNKEEYAKTSRAWSNMVFPGSKLPSHAKTAREVYKGGQLEDVALFSTKLAELVKNVEQRAEVGKQYIYSAFGEQGIHQIADVLEAQGWTNVSGKLKPLYEALAALRATGMADASRARERVEAAIAALPGTPFRRFITTREWRDDGPAGGKGIGSITGDEEESSQARTTEQLMELDAFNALRNVKAEGVALLIASKKFNEGLDLKAIRTLHIFEPLISVSAEQQTVGRGRRYCSHFALDPADRNMVVMHYFSVEPAGQAELIDSVDGLEHVAAQADAAAHEAASEVMALQQRVQLLAARAGGLQYESGMPRAHPDSEEEPRGKAKRSRGRGRARSPLAPLDSESEAEEPRRAERQRAEEPRRVTQPKAHTKRKPQSKRAGSSLDDAMARMTLEGGDFLADVDALVNGDALVNDDASANDDALASAGTLVDDVLGGGRTALGMLQGVAFDLPAAALSGALSGARQWWEGSRAAEGAVAREADAHIAEVRQALLQQERAMEAAERRLADAQRAGVPPDWTALVQADLARDRVRVLKDKAVALEASRRAVAKDVKAVTASRVAEDVQAQLTAIQIELQRTVGQLEEATGRVIEAKAEAAAARRQAAERRAQILPEWKHLLNGEGEEQEGPVRVVGTGVGGRVLKRDIAEADKAAAKIMLTDTLIHGISRREYEPMKVLLRVMRDAAVDCKILHGLHARMGLETHCSA